jgi:nucleoside phosphorylase
MEVPFVIVDRQWAVRNTGVDPLAAALPPQVFAHPELRRSNSDHDLRRELIDFDSEAPHGQAFLEMAAGSTGLSKFADIPWPEGLAPRPATRLARQPADPLPRADVLVVTWTVDEGHALSRVLTPGRDSHDGYLSYTHHYDEIAKTMRPGCPAREAKRLGAYWTTHIGTKSVVVFKSDSHMSQDGPELANATVWQQIIEEVRPSLVLTTGTAGGIGKEFEVGDVIVSPLVRFDCTKSSFRHEAFAQAHYLSEPAHKDRFAQALDLFNANAARLPPENTRPPRIFTTEPRESALKRAIVTTDFFGFDTDDDHYHLQGLGRASEMGDAVLGLVASRMNGAAPRWVAVRNVSDPEIKSEGLTLEQQGQLAAHIYKSFGRWSSVCSAIVCWALVVAS